MANTVHRPRRTPVSWVRLSSLARRHRDRLAVLPRSARSARWPPTSTRPRARWRSRRRASTSSARCRRWPAAGPPR